MAKIRNKKTGKVIEVNDKDLHQYGLGGRQPIYVNDPRDEKLHSYLDSLNLYNSYQTQLKYNPPQDVNKSLAAKYLKPGTEAYNNNVNARQIFNKNSPAKNAKYFKNVTSDYWHSEAQFKKDVPEDAPLIDAYKKLSFSTPTKTGLWTTPDLYNSSIAPVDIYFGGQKPESSAWNPIYKKPVQPYAYSGNSTDYEQYRSSPTIVGTNRIFKPVNNLSATTPTSTLTSIPTIVKNRPKENITTLNQEQQYLPQKEQHLEFDLVGLKKGTYFTRPRQQQEVGQGKMDYFDNKTGKLLKTMEFGGNITTENNMKTKIKKGKKLPKAGGGDLIPFTQDAAQNNQYNFNQPNYTAPASDYGDIDESLYTDNSTMYNPSQTYNPNVITDTPIVNTPEFNPGLSQSVIDYNKQMGRGKTNVYGSPEELSQLTPGKTNTNINWNNSFPGITGLGGNTFLSKGISQLGSGLTNIGKGTLDMFGNMKMNNRQQYNDAKKFQQSVYSDAENRPQKQINGQGILGGNHFADGGMNIKEIGGQGEPNVEIEGGGYPNKEGEHVLLPNGYSESVKGATHKQGGIELNLAPGSMIFSEKLKDPTTGKSYAKLAKPFETKKDVERKDNKRGDIIQKNTADFVIKFKEDKLKGLFEQQEQDKLSGTHGKKVQMEAIEQLNPMAEHGKLIKYSPGGSPKRTVGEMTKNNNLGTNQLNSGYKPNKYPNWDSNFYFPLEEYLKYRGIAPQDFTKKDHLEYQQFISKNFSDPLNDLMRNSDMGLTNKHRKILKEAGVKNADAIADFSQLSNEDFNKIKQASKNKDFDLDKDFLEKGYEDNLRGHRGIVFKPQNITPEQARKQYQGKPYFYNSDDPEKMLFNYTQEGDQHVFHYPTNTEKPAVNQPVTPTPEEKIIYKDKLIKGDNNINLPQVNLGLPLPNIYGRDPLNYYKVQPEYIDPRYLNVQPQLNDITRGVRTVQNNLGDRSTASVGNSLQAQINAYGQENQVYGNKYNYDKGQDSQAQQFNAQAKMTTDQYNQGTWFSELENPIRQREGIIDTQYRTDRVGALNNWNEQQAFYNNKDYIENTFNPGTTGVNYSPDFRKSSNEEKLKAKAKEKVLLEQFEKEFRESQGYKNGGKIKMKLKLKK